MTNSRYRPPTILLRRAYGPCLYAALAGVFATGCGVEPHRDAKGRESSSAVTLASPDELAAEKTVAQSYIVTFRNPGGLGVRGFGSFRSEYAHYYSWLAADHLADPRVVDLDYISAVNLADPRDLDAAADLAAPPALQLAWTAQRVDPLVGTIARVDFASEAAAAEVLKEWEQEGRLWFAEPNYANQLPAAEAALGLGTASDYADRKIWWHEQVRLPEALAALETKGVELTEQVIAVLDSGVDVEHPALADRIWVNPNPGSSQCPGDIHGCDVTEAKKAVLGNGNVFPFSTSGYSQACGGTPENSGVCQHGTHVAGIIAGKLGAQGDVGGVCPVCKILVIKIIKNIKGKGSAPDSAILNGLKYLTRFKKQGTNANLVRVANASFGKTARSRAVALLVGVLRAAPHEVLVIGAAGNEDTMNRNYPAGLNDALAVSALNDKKGKAVYSNFGPWVDIAAPGGDIDGGERKQILSSVPGGGTYAKQGTSMAAPIVAGAAGLILAADPSRSFTKLRASLVETADPSFYSQELNPTTYTYYYPKPGNSTSRRPLLGAGLLDVAAAIANEPTERLGLVGSRQSRVTSECGVIGAQANLQCGTWMMLLVGFLVPMVNSLRRWT